MSVILILWLLFVATSAAISRLSHTGLRGHPPLKGSPLKTVRQGTSGVKNYFIAGTLNQPASAFRFLLNHPALKDDSIAFVSYSPLGVNFDEVCDCIEDDIFSGRHKNVRIFAISVGCKVTHFFNYTRWNSAEGVGRGYEFQGINIECFDINPCWSPAFLKPTYQHAAHIFIPVLSVLDLLLGWVSCIPLIPAWNNRFSPRLLMTQLHYVFSTPDTMRHLRDARNYSVSHEEPLSRLLILSSNDQFLENARIIERYGPETQVVTIDTTHANTDEAASLYRSAFEAYFGTHQS